ncbi:MAG: hypothetical protein J6B63_01990 [Treponema sp.]|nr:hypothetical protein [Treponema sp.]MBP3615837.1 hypothetical protein [Alphaproteobacteria bacterium]
MLGYWEPHYYKWTQTNPDTGKYLWAVDLDHQRDVIDRYEYNEQYNVRSVDRYKANIWLGEMYKYAQFYINDEVFAKPCDEQCGGLESKGNPLSTQENRLIECGCNNYTHAAYQLREWIERYGYWYLCAAIVGDNNDCEYWIPLDETDRPKEIDGSNEKYRVNNNYAQLYIPYETFKAACRQIKTVYSANPVGYFNYMRYWAKNGNHTQICNYTENAGDPYGTTRVINTYLVSNFWNSYDGTKDPVTGQAWKDEAGNVIEGKKAIGWL